MTELREGDTAPQFPTAGTTAGPAVLYFYPKDDTPGCTAQAVGFSALRPEFEKLGATIVGVSPDSERRHDNFRRKHGLSIELVSDTDRRLAEAFGVWGEKSMFGRKYMSVKRTTFLIDAAGTIRRIWRDVSVPGHAEEVLGAVRDLTGHGTD